MDRQRERIFQQPAASMPSWSTPPALYPCRRWSAAASIWLSEVSLIPLSAIAAGADVVVIGSFNNSAPYVMAARPDVRELKDLKGRKVGVRSLTGPATAMTQFMLEEAGLDAKRDVTILRVGGTALRLTALTDGQIDAALVDETVARRARESGLNVIHLHGVPHIHTGVYVRRSRLLQREALIVAALQALARRRCLHEGEQGRLRAGDSKNDEGE